MQILIIEDEKRLADALGQIMQEARYQADIVYDGRDGLAYASSGDYDVIVLDASSTVYSMIPYLKDFKNVVAITSGLKTALALGERHIKTYLTGGLMIDNSYSMIGGYARDMLETINADAVFFSCRGVSADGRMTDSSVEECELRKLMFRHAKRRVLMAAHNKIGRDYFYVQGHVSEIDDIVSDGPLPVCFSQPGADGRAPQIHIG